MALISLSVKISFIFYFMRAVREEMRVQIDKTGRQIRAVCINDLTSVKGSGNFGQNAVFVGNGTVRDGAITDDTCIFDDCHSHISTSRAGDSGGEFLP